MEKRRHKRIPCEIESHYKRPDAPQKAGYGEVTLHDLSQGGVRFRRSRFMPVHQHLLLRFQIPKSEWIETWAELAWIRELPTLGCYEAGAQFLNFPSQHSNLLQQFIFQQLLTLSPTEKY